MTAVEIADRCGVHVSQVYRWELGKSMPHGPALGCLLLLANGAIRPEDLKRRAAAAPVKSGKRKRAASRSRS